MNKLTVILLMISIPAFSGEMIISEGVATGDRSNLNPEEVLQLAKKRAEDNAGVGLARHSNWRVSSYSHPGGTGTYQYRARAAFKTINDQGPFTIKVSEFVYWSMNQFGLPEPLATDSYGKERILKLAQFYCGSEVIEPTQYTIEGDIQNRTSGFDRFSGVFSCKISTDVNNGEKYEHFF